MEEGSHHILTVWVSFLTLFSVFDVASSSLKLFPSEQESSPDAFPACVEVDAVWPPPHSILKPFYSHKSLVHYNFRIRFSRPVGIEDKDTTGGFQPELASRNTKYRDERLLTVDNYAPVFLSPSPTNFTRYYPHRLRKWYGSDRTIMAYFTMSEKTAKLEITE